MQDRSLAIIVTIILVILLALPGLAFLCVGLTDFIVYYGFQNPFNVSAGFANLLGFGGLCVGAALIIITIVAGFFMLRRKTDLPPKMPDQPNPPTQPDEPIPPSI